MRRVTKKEFENLLLELAQLVFRLDKPRAKLFLRSTATTIAAERIAAELWRQELPESEDTQVLRHQLTKLDRDGFFDLDPDA